MGDKVNQEELKVAKDLFFKAVTASVVRVEERYEFAAASTSCLFESRPAPECTFSGSRAHVDNEAHHDEDDKQGREGQTNVRLWRIFPAR